MTVRVLLLVSLCLAAQADKVFHRKCGTGDPSACRVDRVEVENCSHAPRHCKVSHGKRYPITVNFMPNFAAESLVLSTMADELNDGSYILMRTTKRACEDHSIVCPLEPEVPQTLRFDLQVDKHLHGAFPVLVNLANAANSTQSCCFTFKTKAMRPDMA